MDKINIRRKQWTKEEDELLTQEIKTMDINDIAKAHNRSVGAIKARLSKQEDKHRKQLFTNLDELITMVSEIKSTA